MHHAIPLRAFVSESRGVVMQRQSGITANQTVSLTIERIGVLLGGSNYVLHDTRLRIRTRLHAAIAKMKSRPPAVHRGT